jgi:hypothetical protein
MALVIGTPRGWLDVDGYLDALPERRALLLSAAAGFLELTDVALCSELEAGKTLADLARLRHKSVDVLKSRVTAALQRTEASLGGLFLSLLVEHLVDLPWSEKPADLAG